MSSPAEWREVRDEAAQRFRPKRVRLLLVAEAPPAALHRYFYFPNVTEHDSLFRYVARLVLDAEPTRSGKLELLDSLRDAGVFLIDVCEEPIADKSDLRQAVPDLVRRVKAIHPEHVILIKATVYDVARLPLKEAGVPVVDAMVPFPGSGQQRRFEEAMSAVLESIDWSPRGRTR